MRIRADGLPAGRAAADHDLDPRNFNLRRGVPDGGYYLLHALNFRTSFSKFFSIGWGSEVDVKIFEMLLQKSLVCAVKERHVKIY